MVSLANGLVCLGFIGWTTPALGLLLPLAFFLGGFGQPLYALCVAHANDNIAADDILPTASSLLLVFSIGSSLGPFFASLTMGQIGPEGLFVFVGLLYLVLLLATLYQIKQHPIVTQEDRPSGFVSTYTTTPVGLELDSNIEDVGEQSSVDNR